MSVKFEKMGTLLSHKMFRFQKAGNLLSHLGFKKWELPVSFRLEKGKLVEWR